MDYINTLGQLLHENPKAARIYRKGMSGLEFIKRLLEFAEGKAIAKK